MDIEEKLRVLSAAARYDASCHSGGSRPRGRGRPGPALPGVCHSWSDDGRCVSLLKVLYTNACIYDCAYCANRASARRPRLSFTPRELADLTVGFYLRNYVEGLFLSSAVRISPDHTMQEMVKVLKLLRLERGFPGYIHVKAIPGADPALLREAALLADRVSVNIELPSEESLRRLAPQKDRPSILGPMEELAEGIAANREERKRSRRASPFAPAGQSTQLIVGASPESDLRIIRLAAGLYRRYDLKRVYYSAFVPVSQDPRLPRLPEPPLLREHRLYQADWLMRFYSFQPEEILDEGHPFLDEELDPKSSWALRNLDFFPVEVNQADYHALLRVPGIGVRSARRILGARRSHSLDFEDLRRMGVVMKRARHFVTCRGRWLQAAAADPESIRRSIRTAFRDPEERAARQLALPIGLADPPVALDVGTGLSGEL